MTDPVNVEAEIQRKGLTAPRVTAEMIDAEVAERAFHVFPGTCLTVCVLTLANGFTVTGESACASPENYDAELGQQIAERNAKAKIWALLGFRLRDQLAVAGTTPYDRAAVELSDLSTKVQRLGKFVASRAFNDLDNQQQDLLTDQLRHMSAYQAVLRSRVEAWHA